FFTDRCLARLMRHRKLRTPFAAPASHYVLMEVEGHAAAEWLAEQDVLDGTVAQTPAQAAELWALREGISESLAATGYLHKNDVALPIAALETFCAEMEALIAERYPDWELCNFGHIGDGNLHVNVMKPDGLDVEAFHARTDAVDRDLFALLQR